jgi:ABC-type antimicrobial peptide transport system permease subunit
VVAQRRKEFGIRIALGAKRRDVTLMVFRQSFRLALAGTAAGLLLAAAAAKILSAGFQGLQAFDFGGWAGGAAVALAAAAAATWLPALRAVRVDPAVTLRCD